MSEASIGKPKSSEHCRNISIGKTGVSHSDVHKKNNSKAQKGKVLSDLTRKKIGDSEKGEKNWNYGKERTYADRVKMSCGIRGISIEDFDGFISDNPYCSKFNDKLKRQVREEYNNCDFISGLPASICNVINGKVHKLSIHHIDYNKVQGCEGHKWLLIPLSHSNHMKTNGNRSFWKRLFCYVLEYDETYYNDEYVNILEMIRNASWERS